MGGVFEPAWLLPALAAPFVGSFVGLLAVRLPAGEGVVWGRSACRSCGHRLAARDLVPVASWLWARGRCRYCRAPVARFYPAVELAALGVVLWAAAVTTGWVFWASCALGWTLLALAVIDQREFVLPDALTLPLIPAGLAVAWLIDPALVPHHAMGAVAGFAVFALVGWVYGRLRGRDGLGLGDAKLLAAAGAWVSWVGLPSVVLLAGAGALAVALIGAAGTGGLPARERAIAFGPYLALALWSVWLHGPIVIG
jgi:leader peptidase (prepilin peptidase) / N-methyltransferase